MAMRIDQSRKKRLLAKVDNFARVAPFDFVEATKIDDSISGNRDCAVLNRRSVHRDNSTRANNHFSAVAAPKAFGVVSLAALSPFTTFRHSATSRLHGSWQSSGITCAVVAEVGDPGPSVWSCDA